nr:hypothetical protein BaRGS_001906 [Batillaria attramentaria]
MRFTKFSTADTDLADVYTFRDIIFTDFQVHYIDFGNSAVVLRSQLKLATPELCRIPQRAYQLVLYNIKPVYLQRHPQDPSETMSQGELSNLERELEDIVEFAHQVDDLNNPSPQTPALREVPAIGMMCTAKYSADNRWYRGLVAKAYPATKTALIFYVDYGDTEVVPLQSQYMPIISV